MPGELELHLEKSGVAKELIVYNFVSYKDQGLSRTKYSKIAARKTPLSRGSSRHSGNVAKGKVPQADSHRELQISVNILLDTTG